jgi:GTP-binding protein
MLIHVIDPMGFGAGGPEENVKVINNELKSYSPKLLKKPQIFVVNKQDLTDADKVFSSIKKALKGKMVMAVSGVSGQGIPELLAEVAKRIDTIPVEESAPAERPIHIKLEPDFWVEKHTELYHVKGKKVERLVAMTNFRYPEAVERTQNILKKIGVERELLIHGAQPGDIVKIGTFEFTFEPQEGFVGERFRAKARRKKVSI